MARVSLGPTRRATCVFIAQSRATPLCCEGFTLRSAGVRRTLLSQHGIAEIADNLSERRRKDAENVLRMLHFLHHKEPLEAMDMAEIAGEKISQHVCRVERRTG